MPQLELRLTDQFGRHQNELTFLQRVNNQDFLFGFALANIAKESLSAEKIDIRVQCSWDGEDIEKAPKFRVDSNSRMVEGWMATREYVL